MILAITHFFIFFTICFGNGSIFFSILNAKEKYNRFEITLIGLVITGLIAQLLNFFIPLNNSLVFLNLFIILLFFSFNIFSEFKKVFNKNYNKELMLILILVLMLVFVNIWCSDFHDDLNHYHYSYILNTDKSKYIFGYNFFHNHYGFSSIWLILQSYLNFDYSRLQDIHLINGLILFLFLSIFICNFEKTIIQKKFTVLDIIFFSILLFVILKYTRLKEFGIDKPATLIFFYIIFLSLKNEIFDKQLSNVNLFIILLLSFFITYVKIVYVPILIFPIYNLLKFQNYKFLFSKFFGILIFFNVLYLLKNFVISGCLIYPIEQLCYAGLDWTDVKKIRELIIGIEIFNKSFSNYEGNLSGAEFIKNLNWIKTWILRNYEELLNISLLIFLCFSILILILSKKHIKSKKNIVNIPVILVFCFFNLILFEKSPVIRMYHHFLIFIVAICIVCIFKNFLFEINKKIFLVFAIALVFNFTKNFIRIHKADYNNNHLEKIKKLGWYTKSKKSNIGDFEYYIGWYDKAIAGQDLSKLRLKYKKILFNYDMIYK